VDQKDVSKYGIVAPQDEKEEGVISVETLVEKPPVHEAPSRYAIMGRYVLTPDIFNILEDLPAGAGGEIQLTDAIKILNEKQPILAYNFKGIRYDVGDKFGFIKATIDFALEREDLKDQVYQYLCKVTDSNGGN
jgi:UTP--glucose-1-phosphate uridylyltransferase